MKILAISGQMLCGKSTTGDLIRSEAPTKISCLAIADKLKNICKDLYGLSDEDVLTQEGKNRVTQFPCHTCPSCNSTDTFEESVQGYTGPTGQIRRICSVCVYVGEPNAFKAFWTVRMILQHVGTEGTRKIDPNVWINSTLHQAKKLLETKKLVVITDLRFKSEMQAVRLAGGEVWRLHRPETDGRPTGLSGHQSELDLAGVPDADFQCVLSNDGTIEDLRAKVLNRLNLKELLR